jgi:hypothetical protein
MDALQRAVYAAVEAGAAAGEEPRATFARVRSLAEQAATARPLSVAAPLRAPPGPVRTPRLTEAWFC